MSFKKLVLAVDLDSTVVDLFDFWLGLYNQDYEEQISVEDLKTWAIGDHVPIGWDIVKYLETPNLFRDVSAYPGACETLERLHEAGHEIHVVTTASTWEHTAADKIWWCRQHLPFIRGDRVTISAQKGRFISDILIDDSPENINSHAALQPHAFRAAIAFPYNAEVADKLDLRAESYKDPEAAWLTIEEFVARVSAGEVRRAA